jgi:hypothetical protein
MLTRQAGALPPESCLYPFGFSCIFLDRVLCLCPGLASDYSFLTYTSSSIVGITGM